MKNQKEDGYLSRLFKWRGTYILLTLVAWGIVPTFAKNVNLPGGTAAMIVNWTALVTVFGIMVVFRQSWQFSHLKQHGWNFVKIGLVWPFAYSIAYFYSIKLGNSSLTTVLNYTWPIFAIAWLMLRLKQWIPLSVMVPMEISVIVLGWSLQAEGALIGIGIGAVVVGLLAGFLQGVFNVESENTKLFPDNLVWLLTFVGALVTAVGSTMVTMVFEPIPAGSLLFQDVWPLMVIGAFSNGVGFWSFVTAIKMSDTPEKKRSFWFCMMFTPVVQVAWLLVPGLRETVGYARLMALPIIALNVFVFQLWNMRRKKPAVTVPEPAPGD